MALGDEKMNDKTATSQTARKRTSDEIAQALEDLLTSIVFEDGDVDYVCVLDFRKTVKAHNCIRFEPRKLDDKRNVDIEHVRELALIERQKYQNAPYSEERIEKAKNMMCYWVPTQISDYVLLFASSDLHPDAERVFRLEVDDHKEGITKLLADLRSEMHASSAAGKAH
jgi:hypothetical protein